MTDSLHNCLDYIPDKGILINKRSGKPGYVRNRDGMVIVTVKGQQYLAHRVIWLFEHNEWPSEDIDHKDGNRSNNHISNLRSVTREVNNQNRRKPSKASKTGYLGVYPSGQKYMAKIRVHKQCVYLGSYSTAEEAYEQYLIAKRNYHEGNTL